MVVGMFLADAEMGVPFFIADAETGVHFIIANAEEGEHFLVGDGEPAESMEDLTTVVEIATTTYKSRRSRLEIVVDLGCRRRMDE